MAELLQPRHQRKNSYKNTSLNWEERGEKMYVCMCVHAHVCVCGCVYMHA